MIYLAAGLSGFGGLLLEMLLLRRFGLLLGNTAEASSLVLACFLLGLGFGGVAVQSEDELGAINAALGAAMTGTRAMTATSGP